METKNTNTALSIERHPQFDEMITVWEKMRDGQSERLVKSRDDSANNTNSSTTKRYLPKTSGQNADFANGETAYKSKKTRAEFPSNLIDTERQMLGLLAKNSLKIELPTKLEPFNESITDDGEDINALNARINEEQLITGRIGLLWDIQENAKSGKMPYVVMYSAERIINWQTYIDGEDEKFKWVVIDISDYEANAKTGAWEWTYMYKVLNADAKGYYTYVFKGSEKDIDLSEAPGDAVYPTLNGKTISEIPFTICNDSSVGACIENPILEPLADSCLKYYRNDADYQELIFMQTIAILCQTGLENADIERLKQLSVTEGFASNSKDAKCSFAEVSGNGLAESRLNLENSKKDMINRGIALMEAGASESGEALSIRLTTKTANLSTVAITASMAIEKMLKLVARWMTGVNEKEITVKSNNDFTDNTVKVEDLTRYAQLVEMGYFTREDFYEQMERTIKGKYETFEDWNVNTEAVNIGIDM